MKNFEIVTYYSDVEEEDGELYGCGDYHYIEVVDKDKNEVIRRYGDYYHDKGQEKLEGFWHGLQYAGVTFSATSRNAKASGY